MLDNTRQTVLQQEVVIVMFTSISIRKLPVIATLAAAIALSGTAVAAAKPAARHPTNEIPKLVVTSVHRDLVPVEAGAPRRRRSQRG
jgi:hypothetical protein